MDNGRHNVEQLEAGKTVVMAIGSATATCVILQTRSNGVVLVPLRASGEFQAALKQMPANCSIKMEDGSALPLKIDNVVSVTALIGTLPAGLIQHQRQFFRVHLDFIVQMTVDGKAWTTVKGLNISEGGMLLSIKDSMCLSIGQPAVFHIRLPECEPIRTRGIIKRIVFAGPEEGGNQLGIQFTNIPGEEARKLAKFIRNYQLQAVKIK